MGRMQRNKGKRGEREAAAFLNEHFGIAAKRTAQCRGDQTADIECGDGLHCEVKRRAKIGAIRFLEQAERDKKPDAVPFVMLREDGDTEWSILVRAKHIKELAVELNRKTEGKLEPLD